MYTKRQFVLIKLSLRPSPRYSKFQKQFMRSCSAVLLSPITPVYEYRSLSIYIYIIFIYFRLHEIAFFPFSSDHPRPHKYYTPRAVCVVYTCILLFLFIAPFTPRGLYIPEKTAISSRVRIYIYNIIYCFSTYQLQENDPAQI